MTELVDTEVGIAPTDLHAQQLISAEKGYPKSGIPRTWLRPDADVPVLVVDETGIKLTRDDGTSAPAPPIVVGSPAGGDLAGTYPNPTFSGASIDALIPPGTIWAYGGAAAPAGWLLCNGAAVSRTTFARLFAALGTAYGPGDGTSTFNLPNLVGRVLLGVSGTHPLGQTGGAETASGPPHTHPGTHGHDVAHSHPGSHSHGLNGHQHDVDLDHNHLVVQSGQRNTDSVGAGFYAEPALGSGTFDHHHPVDLLPLGAAPRLSAAPAPSTSGSDTSHPSSDTPTSGLQSTDQAAVYPGSVAILPPFGTAAYIIRAGA